jgi:long-chain acyl-CoA synthetase
VCGEGRSFLTALVVPHWANLCKAAGLDLARGEEALATEPAVRAIIERRIEVVLAEVSPWERVKRVAILAKPFSVANEEMTVSLKLRRGVIGQRHKAEIEALYAEPVANEDVGS